jgi:hypothetical protein
MKTKPEKKNSLLKFIIMKNMAAFDLMNIYMTMYISCEKKILAGGFCCGKNISGNNKKFPHGRPLLLEQVTFR